MLDLGTPGQESVYFGVTFLRDPPRELHANLRKKMRHPFTSRCMLNTRRKMLVLGKLSMDTQIPEEML
jgi:hypothetical protein